MIIIIKRNVVNSKICIIFKLNTIHDTYETGQMTSHSINKSVIATCKAIRQIRMLGYTTCYLNNKYDNTYLQNGPYKFKCL